MQEAKMLLRETDKNCGQKRCLIFMNCNLGTWQSYIRVDQFDFSKGFRTYYIDSNTNSESNPSGFGLKNVLWV